MNKEHGLRRMESVFFVINNKRQSLMLVLFL